MTVVYIVIGILSGLAIGWLLVNLKAATGTASEREARAGRKAEAAAAMAAEREAARAAADTLLEEMNKQLEAQRGLLERGARAVVGQLQSPLRGQCCRRIARCSWIGRSRRWSRCTTR